MSKIIGDNYSYKGKQPNFARDQFATKAEMDAFNPDFLDQGHISYCVEDDTHYKFNGTEWVKLIEDVEVEGGLSQVALPILDIKNVSPVPDGSANPSEFIGVIYNIDSGRFIAAIGSALPGVTPTITGYISSWAATDKYPAPAVYDAKSTLYLKGTELYGFVDGSLQLVGDGNSEGLPTGSTIGENVKINSGVAIDSDVTIGSVVSIGGRVFIGENVEIPSGFNGNNISGGGLPEGVTLDTEAGPIILGTNTTGASIGIEPDVHIQKNVTISEYVSIGSQVTMGDNVNIGKDVYIPDGFNGSNISGGGGGLPDGVTIKGEVILGEVGEKISIGGSESNQWNSTLHIGTGFLSLGQVTIGTSKRGDDLIHIGERVNITSDVTIGSVTLNNVTLTGDICMRDSKVTLGTIARGDEDLYISNNVKILENVNIGKNVIIPEGFDGSKVSGAIIIQ